MLPEPESLCPTLEIQFRLKSRCLAQIRQEAAMQKLFSDHPATVGETYFEHMGTAFTFAARLLGASLACFIHGLFPFLFTSTGSATVKRLYQGMVVARAAQRSVSPQLERARIAAAVDQ
jgi:hypothetical protein